MKTTLKYISIITLALHEGVSFSHHRPVHERITDHAAQSAFTYSPSFLGFFDTISYDCSYKAAVNSMVAGSNLEDDFFEDAGGARSLNHFYDPLTGLGLSNIPYDDRPRSGPVGIDSFTWGSKRNSPGKLGTYNVWSWQNARDHEWLGLTATTPAARTQALLDMFRAIGQVVHLVEDASQPEHVRNEQHLTPGSPIEKFGGKNIANLNYQHGILNWRAAGFTKLQDFWDRQLYNGFASALVNDATAGPRLGMAEFVNGNFLGGRHLFPEYFSPGDVQHYPFPSRDKSTDYAQVQADPALGLHTFTLDNDQQHKGIYIKKTADGITGHRLSRINYLGAKTVFRAARQSLLHDQRPCRS